MNALDKLGLAIANVGYTWTLEMRQAYEEGIKELEAAALAEREECAKLAENWDFNVQGLVKAIKARIDK